MVTDLQKRAAQAIVHVFETSKVLGDYASVVFVRNDPGELTYGKSQATLKSGNLHKLINLYCNDASARYGANLQPYLPQLQNKDSRLNHDRTLHGTLRDAGGDPVMQKTQDDFFEQIGWKPAIREAGAIGINTPLGIAVVYDSIIHGSWARNRDRTTTNFGTASAIGE